MSKKKKWMIVVLVTCLLAAGVCFGVHAYLDNQIQFAVNDTLPDGQYKKATVILLGGQSNASGCGIDEYLKKNVSPEQYARYESGFDNVYINYYASGKNMSNGFVKCATRQGEIGGYFGPELGLAEMLHEKYPDEQFFIIKYAWGGSALYDQWLSPSSPGKTGRLYKEFVKYVETSMSYLRSKNYDVKIEGMCWMQGESDSFFSETATDYKEHLSNFIKDIRNKFSSYASDDGIAFIDAYIAASPAFWVFYEQVNQAKQAVADLSPMNVVIDTNAYGLKCSDEPEGAPDMPHYDSMSQIKLGHLFAEEIVKFFD